MTPAATHRLIRVLVVEDHEEDFQYIKYLLRKNTFSTYRVDWAPNYEAGMEAIRRREHDVGLFDYVLGGRTGLDLIREAAALETDMPMILLTGHESYEVDQEASAAGAADYLCKVGLSTTQLERAIRYSLRHAAMLSVVRKSQNQLELFMRNVPCAVCIRDERGEVLFQNDRYRNHFENVALLPQQTVAAQGDTWPFSHESRHWLVSSFPMIDARGQRLEGLAAIEITERIRAEEMLRSTIRVLNGILTTLPVVVGSVDQDGTILESRGRGLADIGLKDADLVGSNLRQADPQLVSHVTKALQGGSVAFTWPVAHGGRTHYFDNYFRFDEARGRGALGFAINVTDRVEAEAARNRQSQLLRAIMQNLPVIAGRIDTSGTVVEVEGEGLANRGIAPEKLQGRPFSEVFRQSRAALRQALDGGEGSFTVSGRSEEDWQVDFIVFFDAENGAGAIFFGRDMTERRWLERKLLEISDVEQQRIGADLHDGLGQHLTGIACMAAALKDRLKVIAPPESKQADEIAKLVNEATAQSRALARGLCPVQLDQTGLQSALEDLTYQVQIRHRVQCRFEVNGSLPVYDHDTAIHLYRITQEAINNAVRHGGAQRVCVRLESNNGTNRLMVEDDGAGFDPRERPSAPGVGLRLMNYRASVIGGTFSISSEPGQGARAECTFPDPPSPNENA